MVKTIRLGAISPDHLNLNGDLGNLLVLEKRLKWRKVSSTTEYLSGSEDFSDYDFIVVGHGSKAAWNQLLDLRPNLMSQLVDYVEAGGALLAVASAADRLQPLLIGAEIEMGERVSEFVNVDGVVGYKNSTTQGSNLTRYKSAVLTQLHGPVFAKNPQLTDSIIENNGWADIALKSVELIEVDELASQSRKTAFDN